MKDIPDCVATGWVDLTTGTLLEVEIADQPPSRRDIIATATTEVLQGANVAAIEHMFQRALGNAAGGHYFREILVMSKDRVHMFARSAGNEDQVLVVIAPLSTNLGRLINRTRAAVSTRATLSTRAPA
ncbi:MAG: hypothetical protein E6J90_11540 [Deltaproteobacteria bacterium]|nr:MAG: hypothetical protein E6J91_04040 [Deltaproteobacteria bacterium]TMQ23001.1 MAG: hypothetical protein E6J90_11540 [Deltaproteobacteria bacterium]